MKTIFQLCVITFLSFAAVSCTKSGIIKASQPTPVNADPYISSKIERNIVQPAEMELGTPAAIIHQGETVTIFVPYSITNESFVNTKITMNDDATGLPLNTYELVSSADPSASQLTLPASMYDQPNFYFVTFAADESYVGKRVSITAKLEGEITYSVNELNAAFTVVP